MKTRFLACLLTAVLLSISNYSNASDQSDVVFDQGSVLVICTPPDGTMLSTEEFNLAFPQWISVMQKQANDGLITRAHYLGALKEGIFIVVAGDDTKQAMANAVNLSDDLNAIYQNVAGKQTGESCRFREIGPVAILPQ